MANSTTLYRAQDGRTWVDVTEAKTLALADCGIVQNVITDAVTVTLPATAAGLIFTVRNGGVKTSGGAAGAVSDQSCLVTISPNASDQISGLAFTPADDKDALNTKATARVGDEMTLFGGDANGYTAHNVKGVWARQA